MQKKRVSKAGIGGIGLVTLGVTAVASYMLGNKSGKRKAELKNTKEQLEYERNKK